MKKKDSPILQNYTWTNIINQQIKSYDQQYEQLQEYDKAWKRSSMYQPKASIRQESALLKFAQSVEQSNNVDRVINQYIIRPVKSLHNLNEIKNQNELYLGVGFFSNKEWKIDFSLPFLQKLQKINTLQKSIFNRLYIFAEGYIHSKDDYQLALQPFDKKNKFNFRYFISEVKAQKQIYYLLISIGVQKCPHYSFNKAKGCQSIQYFDYSDTITCQELFHFDDFKNQKILNQSLEQLKNLHNDNPRINFSYSEIRLAQEEMNNKLVYYQQKKRDNPQKFIKQHPNPYKRYIPNEIQIQDFSFRVNSFISQRKRDNQQNNENNSLQNQLGKVSYIDFGKFSKILQSLKSKVQNFRYKLVPQQKEVLSKNGNLIVVGRSGTGKTTCAMLRLYGIEFMSKTEEYKKQKELSNTKQKSKCMMKFMQETQIMKNVFLTFSSVLIDEIHKQYGEIVYQIKKRHSQNCVQCLKELKINQNDEEEDIFDKLNRIEDQQQKKVVSLHQNQSLFPAFFTIDRFIRIIDLSLYRPFFCHVKNINGKSNNKFIKESYINKYKYESQNITLQKTHLAISVDYELFLDHFWVNLPKDIIKNSLSHYLLTPSVVWSQIFSILKGSLNSYLSPTGYIGLKDYIDEKLSIFQKQPENAIQYKKQTYQIMKRYANWCQFHNCYDLMDVVNHILRQLQFYGSTVPKVNHMFIDEVQDLTTSTIYLISKMVINNIFYCGDTAQAITKGVSFRFQELRLLFNKEHFKHALTLEPPEQLLHLTVNFRSHNFILQFANSIISTIQCCFPHSINKLTKEKSDLCGPKPILVIDEHYSTIFQILCGKNISSNRASSSHQNDSQISVSFHQGSGYKKSDDYSSHFFKQRPKQAKWKNNYDQKHEQYQQNRKLNSEQIIIVRNQQQKERLPRQFSNCVVFTPQTVKGLQFNCVILYNFFTSCSVFEKWGAVLEHLECYKIEVSPEQFQQNLNRRSQQQNSIETQLPYETKIKLGYDKNSNKYIAWGLRVGQSIKALNMNSFHELITQLKILYTAITRARNVFIIYDKKIPIWFEKLWISMGLVQFSNKSIYDQIKQYIQVKQSNKEEKKPSEDDKWKTLGRNLLARKDYENAKKCFYNIGQIDIVQRIQALQLQKQAQTILHRISSTEANLSKQSRDNRKLIKIKLQKEKITALQNYLKAGQKYLKYMRYKEGGQAFFKGQNYTKALACFNQTKDDEKIIICCKKLNRYKQVREILVKKNDHKGLIDSFIQEKNWNQLYDLVIIRNKEVCTVPGVQKAIQICLQQTIIQAGSNQWIKKGQYQYRTYFKELLNNQISLTHDNYKCILSSSKLIIIQSNLYHLANTIQRINPKIKELSINSRQYFQKMSTLETLYTQNENQTSGLLELQSELDQLYQLQKSLKLTIYDTQYRSYTDFFQLPKIQEKERQLAQLLKNKAYTNGLLKEAKKNLEKLHEQICQFENDTDFLRDKLLQINKQKHISIREGFSSLSKVVKNQNQYVVDENREKNSFNTKYPKNILMSKLNIGGIQLMQSSLLKYVQDIEDIIDSVREINFVFPRIIYPQLSHKYMQQFIFQQVYKRYPDVQQCIYTLKVCDFLKDYKSCLAICNYYPELISLSFKYIVGIILQKSKNFIINRQYQIQEYLIETNPSNENIQKKASSVKIFLAYISKQALYFIIPTIFFEKKIYYETILSQLNFSMVLQGFYRQILLFCQYDIAIRLSYLYSDYGNLTKVIRKIAKQMNKKTYQQKHFLFIDDVMIFKRFPQASSINLYSIQSIIYSYDQIQDRPFLSKKKKEDDIDIEEQFIKQSEEKTWKKKLKKLRQEKYQIQKSILEKSQHIKSLQKIKRQHNPINIKIQQNAQKGKLYQLDKQIEYQFQKKNTCSKQLDQMQTEQSRLLNKMNISKIKKKDKEQLQEKIQNYQYILSNYQQKSPHYLDLKDRIQNIRTKYEQMKRSEKQAFQNHQKYTWLVQSKKAMLKHLTAQLQLAHQRKAEYQGSLRQQVNQYDIIKICNQQIQVAENQIKQLRGSISKVFEFNKEDEQKQFIINQLIKQQKKNRLDQLVRQKRKTVLDQIRSQSNIPSQDDYQFLKNYIKGEFSGQGTKKLSQKLKSLIIFNLIKQHRQLQKFLAEEKQIYLVEIKICNIIIFYLSYLFTKNFRQDVNNCLNFAESTFIDSLKQKERIEKKIYDAQTQIQFLNNQIQKSKKRRNRSQQQYNTFKRDELDLFCYEHKKMLNNLSQFSQSPIQLLNLFMQCMHKKILSSNSQNIKFIDYIIGFFQCRVIRNCHLLSFIQKDYVLVYHSSIIIQKMRQHKKKYFGYFFDQQNQVILCKFQEVLQTITTIIQDAHDRLTMINPKFNSSTSKTSNKKRFILKETVNHKYSEVNKHLYQLSIFENNKMTPSTMSNLYNNYFIGEKFGKDLKLAKQTAIVYLLEVQHKDSDQYYFVCHQIKQYFLLENLLKQMPIFNYELISQLKYRFQRLQEQYKCFLKQRQTDGVTIPK